jgi:DNA-binding transcriptional MocR family regulator
MTVAGAVGQADIRAAPVARDTLQERVYNRLASLILDGGIPPGRLVTIQSLAEAFGVSAMPVREALKRLTASNALTVVSGRSIGVPPITLERFRDLRNVRRIGRDDGLSQGQPLVPLYDLSSLGVAGVSGADRKPLVANQPLLQSSSRFRQLRLGQLQPSDCGRGAGPRRRGFGESGDKGRY